MRIGPLSSRRFAIMAYNKLHDWGAEVIRRIRSSEFLYYRHRIEAASAITRGRSEVTALIIGRGESMYTGDFTWDTRFLTSQPVSRVEIIFNFCYRGSVVLQ